MFKNKLLLLIIQYSVPRLYITTELQQPNYPAELAAKVMILNFSATRYALSELLLGVIVSRERPDVEAEKNQLIIQKADTKRSLTEEEDKILEILTAEESVLDSDASVQVISTSKMMINELLEKLSVAKSTEKQIDGSRFAYDGLAQHAALLYFSIG